MIVLTIAPVYFLATIVFLACGIREYCAGRWPSFEKSQEGGVR